MAFTESEKLSISKILGMPPTLLDAHLLSLGTDLTEARETEVRAELTRWTTGKVGSQFYSLTPTDSNRGLNLRTDSAKADVRRNIRVILEILGDEGVGGMGTIKVGQ